MNTIRWMVFFTLAVTLLSACLGSVTEVPVDTPPPTLTEELPAPWSATPFTPDLPTETPVPTPTATITPLPTVTPLDPWGDFPAPIRPSPVEIPPPMPRINFSPNTVNVILLGSDQRPYTGGYRTDTMMILSLDPDAEEVTLISMPRDLYVYIPGWKIDRINTADVRGGFEMTQLTILYNFGIEIDYWARVNFSGFQNAINTLGGITVQSTGYLNDECGGIHWRYGPGSYHMDGFTALCYVRMRKTSSDFDRLRRQQEVAQAIFNRITSMDGLSHVPELYSQFGQIVQTDIPLEKVTSLVPLAITVSSDPSQIQRFTLDTTMAVPWRVPYSGAAVLLPNRAAIQKMLTEAFGAEAVAGEPLMPAAP